MGLLFKKLSTKFWNENCNPTLCKLIFITTPHCFYKHRDGSKTHQRCKLKGNRRGLACVMEGRHSLCHHAPVIPLSPNRSPMRRYLVLILEGQISSPRLPTTKKQVQGFDPDLPDFSILYIQQMQRISFGIFCSPVWVSFELSNEWMWWTGKPGVLQSMRSQRVRHDWATELNWTEWVPLTDESKGFLT